MFSSNNSQVSSDVKYIEDYFSTYLYSGTGANQSINNGIDLATKGGLVWQKCRSTTKYHVLTDTVRGAGYGIYSNTTDAQDYASNRVPAFNTNGFDTGANSEINASGATFASWTFAKTPKFFDVVTYTGDGTNGRTVAHSLGSAPGCIMIKRTSASGAWYTWHRSLTADKVVYLNTTAAEANPPFGSGSWISSDSTTVTFPNASIADVNNNGYTYVMYLFAHNAGGFGLTGTDNVISCGSFNTGAGGGASVNLGYEPQWLMIKSASATSNWYLFDNMRGWVVGGASAGLAPNTSAAEFNFGNSSLPANPTATGFNFTNGLFAANETWIYIAIRRGPMKVPTSGTSVFYPNAIAQTDSPDSTNVPFPPDLVNTFSRDGVDRYQSNQFNLIDRLRGLGTPNNTYSSSGLALTSSSTGAESSSFPYVQLKADSQNITRGSGWNSSSYGNWIYYFFRRAPSFFDEVCWTGTGSGSQAITHNLGVAPEFTITKRRSGTGNWSCFPVMFGVNTGIYIDSTAALQTNAALHPTLPTATTYYTNDASWGDENIGGTFVTYLFATCAGVSKVGSYTGTGTTKQVDCGFAAGARFVLIKKTSGTGSWYVWDVARGIVSGNDPYLLLNSTAAEVTNTDYIDAYSAGFEISSTAPSEINENGGSFIFLAIS